MKILIIFLGGLSFFITCFVFAYIPKPEMILSRLNKTKGVRSYRISQRLIFLDSSKISNSVEFRELWERGREYLSLRVTQSGDPQFKIYFLYKNSTKRWINSSGKRLSKKGEFVEPYFLSKSFNLSRLSSVESLSLKRTEGVVNYFFDFPQKGLSLWVEQDEFVVRKIKFSKISSLRAENYKSYPGGLFFPKKRRFLSSNFSVVLETLNVEILNQKPFSQLKPNQWGKSKDKDLLKSFYQNVR